MSNVIAGALVLALILVVVFGTSQAQLAGQQAMTAAQEVASARDRILRDTSFTMSNSSTDGTGAQVTLDLANTGATILNLAEGTDLVVNYTQPSGTRVIARLNYATVPSSNEWTVSSITPDTYNPWLLDPAETAHLTVKLSPPIKNGTTGVIRIAVANGTAAQTNFTR